MLEQMRNQLQRIKISLPCETYTATVAHAISQYLAGKNVVAEEDSAKLLAGDCQHEQRRQDHTQGNQPLRQVTLASC